MIHQFDINGRDKVEVAILRLKTFEPPEGYYLAFSGGKDSVVCKALCDMAGVKYDAHYNITSVDPPELVQFVKTFPDVTMDRHHWKEDGKTHKAGDPITMWNLISEKTMPPTRLARYCCQHLKEHGGDGRMTITGVRWAESANRRNNQGEIVVFKPSDEMLESEDFFLNSQGGTVLVNDNEESRKMVENCYKLRKTLVNPIIDWTNDEVWEFIKEYNVAYCSLYDEGFSRLGCVGCPLGGGSAQKRGFERWPKIKNAYLKAFERMLKNMDTSRTTTWKSAEDVMTWWVNKKAESDDSVPIG